MNHFHNGTIPDTSTSGQLLSPLKQNFQNRPPGFWLVILAGFALALAHPPVGLFPLAWFALAPLIRATTEARRARTAALYGYGFGWAFLGVTWYWIALTIGAWTNSLPLGIVAWFGLTAILAFFYAGFGLVSWHIVRRAKTEAWGYFGLASVWVVMEWARTLGSLTMPWAQLSYSQFRFLPLIQISDFTGAYGVSFLVFLLNVGFAHLWRHRGEFGASRFAWAFVILNGFALFYGAARLMEPDTGEKYPVAVAQTGLDPLVKTTAAEQWAKIEETIDRARALKPTPELLVFAESDLPAMPGEENQALLRLAERQKSLPFTVVINGRSRSVFTGKETNATHLFSSRLEKPLFYYKRQLVPFGEFIPYRSLWPRPLQQTFGFFEEDVEAGDRFSPLIDGKLGIGVFICYESMYPQYARMITTDLTNLLVTQSNDAWFQSRAAQEQHLSAVVLRAIENRRDVVRSTTNGITGILDSHGRIVQRLPANVSGLLSGEVSLRTGRTPWTLYGDWFVYLCLATMMGVLCWQFAPMQRDKNRRAKG